MRAVLLFALLGLACTGSGCISLFDWWPEGTKESPRYLGTTRSRLWQDVKEVVNRHWRLKEIDEEDYYLETEWEEHLGPMYKSGLRRRVHAWVYDSPAGAWWEVQVIRELNDNIKHTLSSSAAEWEADGRDKTSEDGLLYEVESRVRPPDASPTAGTDETGAQYKWDPAKGETAEQRKKRLWRRGRDPSASRTELRPASDRHGDRASPRTR